jgi:hypothetical protein
MRGSSIPPQRTQGDKSRKHEREKTRKTTGTTDFTDLDRDIDKEITSQTSTPLSQAWERGRGEG